MNARFWGILFLFAWPFLASADVLNDRAVELEHKLIAPCCWGSIVAEHSSPAALEIKHEIREFIGQGWEDTKILAYFAQKHGERVLAVPTSEGFNLTIWIMPFVLMLAGTIGVAWFLRSRAPTVLSPEEPRIEISAADREKLDREIQG